MVYAGHRFQPAIIRERQRPSARASDYAPPADSGFASNSSRLNNSHSTIPTMYRQRYPVWLMPSFGRGGCWLIASFARRGRFSNTGWTIAYEQPRFFSLEHRTLTTLRRSAQPIGANRVLAINEPLAGLEATRTGSPSFPRRPDPVPAGAFPSPRSSWGGLSVLPLCPKNVHLHQVRDTHSRVLRAR